MRVRALHRWNVTPRAAVEIQNKLRGRVIQKLPSVAAAVLSRRESAAGDSDHYNFLVAGADISYNKGSDRLFGAVIVLRMTNACFEIAEIQRVIGRATFPYVPGLLSFREAPILLKAFAKLRTKPDVLLVDGQGLAHPRRFGIACHLGVLLNIPTIGCAKSRLLGEFKEPRAGRCAWSDLVVEAAVPSRKKVPDAAGDSGRYTEIIGRVLRTKDDVKPVFVSVGHKIDFDSAVRVVLACCTRYRLPEPTRLAHIEVNRLRLAAKK